MLKAGVYALRMVDSGEVHWLDHWLDERQRDQNLATGVAAAGGVFALLMMVAACALAAFFARASAAVRAALQSARDAAVSADRAKSQFLATASHDLRQPLHALGLFLAQLRAATNPADRDRLLGRIDAAVTAMNELFNALLDISKLDGGALALNYTDFSMERLLGRIEERTV